eukprot:3859527-Amphidinium_carterae.1
MLVLAVEVEVNRVRLEDAVRTVGDVAPVRLVERVCVVLVGEPALTEVLLLVDREVDRVLTEVHLLEEVERVLTEVQLLADREVEPVPTEDLLLAELEVTR